VPSSLSFFIPGVASVKVTLKLADIIDANNWDRDVVQHLEDLAK